MTGHRPPHDAVELDGSDSLQSVISVAEDFSGLIAVFDRQLELAGDMDNETRSHLIAAKAAAERGAELSRELVKRLKRKR